MTMAAPSQRGTVLRMALVLAIILAGHVALWMSDQPFDAKLRLTLINAAIWAVVLLPAVGVMLWLRAHQRRNAPWDPDISPGR